MNYQCGAVELYDFVHDFNVGSASILKKGLIDNFTFDSNSAAQRY